MQPAELAGHLLPFLLQGSHNGLKVVRLAGADLKAVLRQQKILLGLGNPAVRGRINLIQKIVKRRAGLGGQHGKVASRGILGFGQQFQGTVQTVQAFPENALGFVGVSLRQNCARAHPLAVRHNVSKVPLPGHIHRLENCHAGKADAVRHGVGDGRLCPVGAVQNGVQLKPHIPQRNNKQQGDGDEERLDAGRTRRLVFPHWIFPPLGKQIRGFHAKKAVISRAARCAASPSSR